MGSFVSFISKHFTPYAINLSACSSEISEVTGISLNKHLVAAK